VLDPVIEDQITRLHQAQKDAIRATKECRAAAEHLEKTLSGILDRAETVTEHFLQIATMAMEEEAQKLLDAEIPAFRDFLAEQVAVCRDLVDKTRAHLEEQVNAQKDTFASLMHCESFDDLVNKIGVLVVAEMMCHLGMEDGATAYLSQATGQGEYAALLKKVQEMRRRGEVRPVVLHLRPPQQEEQPRKKKGRR
jgi:hypothetical protein